MHDFNRWVELKEWLERGETSCKDIISKLRNCNKYGENDEEIVRLTSKLNTISMVLGKAKELERE